MFASSGFGIIALFGVLSAMVGEDRRRKSDSGDNFRYFGRWFR